jgi:hypothetical protein
MTDRTAVALALAIVAAQAAWLDARQQSPGARATSNVVSTNGRAEVTDPAGDVGPIIYLESVGNGPEKEVKYPGLDLVKLVISSDGKDLVFAATLSAPPANAASDVVEFHIDADNNPKTGVTHPDSRLLTGMEFYGALEACLEHTTFGTSCASADPRPSGHTAVVTLAKYGRDWMFTDALYDLPAGQTVKEPRKTPISGPIVQAAVDYSSMGLKSGQTIRLVVREVSAGKVNNVGQGYLPEILLTLR